MEDTSNPQPIPAAKHVRQSFSPSFAALVLFLVVACRQSPQPSYVRLEGPSPRVEHALTARAHLFVFWASWCAPCRKETPGLLALAHEPPTGLAVVVFSHDDQMKAVEGFFGGEPDPALHLRLDSGHEVARSFGVESLPASILTVEGQLVARFSGPQEWNSSGTRNLLGKLIEEAGTKPRDR